MSGLWTPDATAFIIDKIVTSFKRVGRKMQKKIFLLCICLLSIGLCACQRDISEKSSETAEQGDSWKAAYQKLLLDEDVKRMALLYLDEDTMPELLVLQSGEYRLYMFDDSQIAEIDMPDAEIRAKAYAPKHVLEDFSGDLAFYWFEYVPYQGLIRVHGSENGERCDHYLSYENGSLTLELEAKFTDYIWHTYSTQEEIANEEFLSRLSDRGYDQLIPCGFLYDNIEDACENIGRVSDSREVLDDFINGKIDALYQVQKARDIPEEGFAMRSYIDLYMDFTMGNSIFLDVIGNTVYNVMEAYGTANQSYTAEMDGKRVVVSAYVSHVGRKYYFIKQYDACGCLVDFYRLSASYDGKSHYSAEDEFKYREQPVTMEEFEEIRDRIQDIPTVFN